jgi:hypothetical protein
VIWIGATLPKCLVGFVAVPQDEAAVGFLELNTINSKGNAAVRVLVFERGDDDLPRRGVLAVGLAVSFLRWRTG